MALCYCTFDEKIKNENMKNNKYMLFCDIEKKLINYNTSYVTLTLYKLVQCIQKLLKSCN